MDLNEREEVLLDAAERGNSEEVTSLLKEEVDLEASDERGRTALARAIICGHLEVVELLCGSGADLYGYSFHEVPHVMLSVFYGHRKLVDYFLHRGVDLADLRSLAGDTALIYSVKFGYHEIAEALIEIGADVNVVNRFGTTPLMAAAISGNIDMARLLLDRGAEVNAVDNLGRSVLRHALRADVGRTFVQLLLGRGADVNSRDRRGRSLLWHPPAERYADLLLGEKFLRRRGLDGAKAIEAFIVDCRVRGVDPLDEVLKREERGRGDVSKEKDY